jgi:hypothetical protein
MISHRTSLAITVLMAGILFLAGIPAAAQGIQASMGEDVRISGYSTAGPYVYLFLTGPNLPVNGVALNDITRRADQGGFTKVSVDGMNDQWTYTWHTNSINGRLDAGIYTVWVVDGPNDLSRLSTADYRTISVTLGKPSISVDTTVQSGGMDLQSVPDGASLMINGEYRGKTPLEINDLSPGNYAVTFSKFGFMDISQSVPVEQGKIAGVKATLQPKTGTLAVNSTPPGARVLLDGASAGLSPVTLTNLSADNHTLTLEKDGYITAFLQVGITAGQVNPVEVTLDPVPVSPTKTPAAAGLVPAMAGAFGVILLGVACFNRRNR